MIKRVKDLYKESVELKTAESPFNDRNYTMRILNDMYVAYHNLSKSKDASLDDKEIYEKFTDNIMPGGFDFCVSADYANGAVDTIELRGYKSIKHGCWLNSLDFITNYGDIYPNMKLAFGIIINKKQLECVRKQVQDGLVPVTIQFVDHGFLFNSETQQIFDPTLGVENDYVYFYKLVDEDVLSSLKYTYNNDSDWSVKDFAYWTKVKIRECRNKYFKAQFSTEESLPMCTPTAPQPTTVVPINSFRLSSRGI